MGEPISMQMDRASLIQELTNDDFAGPMIHLRSWAEIQVLMHRAADLLREDEEGGIVRAALASPAQQEGETP